MSHERQKILARVREGFRELGGVASPSPWSEEYQRRADYHREYKQRPEVAVRRRVLDNGYKRIRRLRDKMEEKESVAAVAVLIKRGVDVSGFPQRLRDAACDLIQEEHDLKMKERSSR